MSNDYIIKDDVYLILIKYFKGDIINIDKKVFPETGKIVVFHNCIEDTNEPHPDSLHGACPVLKGEKWAFNLWFREKSRSS